MRNKHLCLFLLLSLMVTAACGPLWAVDGKISVSPDPFTPTGDNSADITVHYTPNCTNLSLRIFDSFPPIPLTEDPAGSGTYTAQFNALQGDTILPAGTYPLAVINDSTQQSGPTGMIHLLGVSRMSVDKAAFDPYQEQIIITIEAIASENIAVQVSGSNGVVRTLPLTGSNGVYTAVWDGRNEAGVLQSAGNYSIYPIRTDSGRKYDLHDTVTIKPGLRSISVNPDPFVATGCNPATITVTANPNQTGLQAEIDQPNCIPCYSTLTETPTGSGTYIGQWNGVVYGNDININGQDPVVRVVDSSYNELPLSAAFKMYGIDSVTASPVCIRPAEGQVTTITASANTSQPVTGLHLEARVRDNSDTTIRALPMSESPAGVYTCVWDGKDAAGTEANSGSYDISIGSADCQSNISYRSIAIVQIDMEVSDIAVSPELFVPTGCNALTLTVHAYPNQTGLQGEVYSPYYGSVFTPLTEDPVGSGTYTGQWDGSWYGSYIFPDSDDMMVYVRDSSGNASPLTKPFRMHGVDYVSASPMVFDPVGGQITTITATTNALQPVAGLHLAARLQDDYGNTARTLAMSESSVGTYTCVWDGKDESGLIPNSGEYQVRIYNTDCQNNTTYSTAASVRISPGVSDIAVSPDPFVATGCNVVTLTVHANPNQTWLQAEVAHSSLSSFYIPLAENPVGSGIYIGQWDGTWSGSMVLPSSDNVTVHVRDSSGGASSLTASFNMRSVDSTYAVPSLFEPTNGQITTITATTSTSSPVMGLHLEARVLKDSGGVVWAITMTEGPAGTYSCKWDGKDNDGNILNSGNYHACIYNTDCENNIKYYPSSPIVIGMGVKSINVTPDPFIPTGCNFTVIAVEASPNQAGLQARVDHPYYGGYYVPLTESPAGSGAYTGQWDGLMPGGYIFPDNDELQVHVVDSSYNESPISATFKLHGIASVTASPYIFEPANGQTTTITATTNSLQPVAGLHLNAQIKDDSGRALKAISMVENPAGTYTCTWDGRDDSGSYLGPGSCSIYVRNTDCDSERIYASSTNVQIYVGGSISGYVLTGLGTVTPVDVRSPHSYSNNTNSSWTIRSSGGNLTRVHFASFDTESGCDYVTITDANDQVVASYSGSLGSFWTPFVSGNTVKVNLISNGSIAADGFVIDKYETDEGMTPVEGISVRLDPDGLTAITGQDGSYRFSHLISGSYIVYPATGFTSSDPAVTQVTLGSGEDKQGINFYITSGMSIPEAKMMADGQEVLLERCVVSAAFSDGSFYLQSSDGQFGIRVQSSPYTVSGDSIAIVGGIMRTNSDGERYIEENQTDTVGSYSPIPLSLTNVEIGGADWNYDEQSGVGQRGVRGGTAPNNIGNLITTTGIIAYSEPDYFYIDDGSSLNDGSGHIGIRVLMQMDAAVPVGSNVKVKGISSCFKAGNDLYPLIRLQYMQDIESLEGGVICGRVMTYSPQLVEKVVESQHPYPNYYSNTWTISGPSDAAYIRIHFEQIALTQADQLRITGEGGYVAESYSNASPVYDVWSDWIGGNTATITLDTSAQSTGAYGFRIDRYLADFETPVSSVSILLEPGSKAATTDASGLYAFSGLSTGSYTLTPIVASGAFIDPSVGNATVYDEKNLTPCDFYAHVLSNAQTISAAKSNLDDYAVALSGKRVTAVLSPDTFYIEEPDRSSGIRVGSYRPVNVGDVVSLTGYVYPDWRTKELYIWAPTVSAKPSSDTIAPLGISNCGLGGSSIGYQQGITGSVGANNTGMLVRTWGKVTDRDASYYPRWFMIDDGSGVLVKCIMPAGSYADPNWLHVYVTGISSCERVNGELHRVLLLRSLNDVQSSELPSTPPIGPPPPPF